MWICTVLSVWWPLPQVAAEHSKCDLAQPEMCYEYKIRVRVQKHKEIKTRRIILLIGSMIVFGRTGLSTVLKLILPISLSLSF